jgi:alpha,alpha-trehalase
LPTELTKASKSEKAPIPLPAELLPDLVRTKRVLLCLDYDGTISEIVADPTTARPVLGISESLAELATHRDRIAIAIVSGREVATLREMLHLPRGIALSGIHGLETVGFDGRKEIVGAARECANELERVRKWLARNVPFRDGFVVEDKRFAITLHYRNTPSSKARELRNLLAEFAHTQAPKIALREGKMAVEALPNSTSKAHAVRTLLQRAGKDCEPVYFGDDLTDEDAFRELSGRGVTVLVSAQRRPSAARFQVENPREVGQVLKAMTLALTEPPVEPQHG